MRKLLLAGVAVGALIGVSGIANAEIVRTFSGSGSQGFLDPAAPSEPWSYCGATGVTPCTPIEDATGAATTDVGWGSPGVSAGETPSNETVPVNDFEINFHGAKLDPAQIALGNTRDCEGTEVGGTVFCSGSTQWTADLANASSIVFTAPKGVFLTPGEDYFVNIMLLDGPGVSGAAFEGDWTVPEPTSLAILGAGLAGLGAIRRRRRKPA